MTRVIWVRASPEAERAARERMAAADRQGSRQVVYEAREFDPEEEELWRQYAALMGIEDGAPAEQSEPESEEDEAMWREWRETKWL